jgi:hypothetical protein
MSIQHEMHSDMERIISPMMIMIMMTRQNLYLVESIIIIIIIYQKPVQLETTEITVLTVS